MVGGKERRREEDELGNGERKGGREGRRWEGICPTNVKLLPTSL